MTGPLGGSPGVGRGLVVAIGGIGYFVEVGSCFVEVDDMNFGFEGFGYFGVIVLVRVSTQSLGENSNPDYRWRRMDRSSHLSLQPAPRWRHNSLQCDHSHHKSHIGGLGGLGVMELHLRRNLPFQVCVLRHPISNSRGRCGRHHVVYPF